MHVRVTACIFGGMLVKADGVVIRASITTDWEPGGTQLHTGLLPKVGSYRHNSERESSWLLHQQGGNWGSQVSLFSVEIWTCMYFLLLSGPTCFCYIKWPSLRWSRLLSPNSISLVFALIITLSINKKHLCFVKWKYGPGRHIILSCCLLKKKEKRKIKVLLCIFLGSTLINFQKSSLLVCDSGQDWKAMLLDVT